MTNRINTETKYKTALARAEKLWSAELSTPEGEELDVLISLIEEYEAIHYPISPPNKEAVSRFRAEQSMPLTDMDDDG